MIIEKSNILISQKQAKDFALSIYSQIGKFISENQDEYQKWLLQEELRERGINQNDNFRAS